MTERYNRQAVEALLGLSIVDTKNTVQKALRIGLRPEQLGDEQYSLLWSTILALYERGVDVDSQVLVSTLASAGKLREAGGKEYIAALVCNVEGSVANAAEYAALIVSSALTRDIAVLGAAMTSCDGPEIVSSVIDRLSYISYQYTQAMNPMVGNPADALERSECWHTSTGLEFIDQLLRLVSGEVHFLAGDPNSGKTTVAIHIASHCARQGIPVVYISAESDAMEVQLSMLSATGKISATQVSRVRYDVTARTEPAVAKIRGLWDECFAELPLTVHETVNGDAEVLSILNSIPVPSVVIIDHAYAVMGQSTTSKNLREHQQFYRFFSAVKTAASRGNHVVVMLNQYTKAGRLETRRGPDSQYGGSGVQNVAGSMIHLRLPGGDGASSSSGYQLVLFEVVKVRSRLVVDEEGRQVEPLGAQGQFFVENRYRRVVSRLPVAGV